MLEAILFRRPRLLKPMHALRLSKAHTQTNDEELATLERYARGRSVALEIGTYMGVSAAVISRALSSNGKLYCVDPWEIHHGKENPCWSICKRELQRNGVPSRVIFLQGLSQEMESLMPSAFDFIFIDGDHSYEGLERDWAIAMRRLQLGGIVCLHDTSVPAAEPFRQFGAVEFFERVIRSHAEFEWLECCYSMNVMRRRVRA